MRISLSLNGAPRAVASVDGPGYLSAHLNMHERPKENDHAESIRIAGTQTLESETIYLDWPRFELKIGDAVELRLLDDGEGDPPSAVRKSSESSTNLFSSADLAKELLQLVSEYETHLMELLEKAEKTEPVEEHKKLTNAVLAVVSEHGKQLLYPVYRRHKELIPDNLKGELL
jgi:hypothetical protein